MSARNPTAFATWVDQTAFVPGRIVRSFEVEQVVEDQLYVLDAPQLLISDHFVARRVTTASPTYAEVGRYRLHATDKCNVDGADVVCIAYVYAWSDGTGVSTIRATASDSTDTRTHSLLATDTTPQWYEMGTIDLSPDGTLEQILLEATITAGTAIFVGGFALIAEET